MRILILDISDIKHLCDLGVYRWTEHIISRMAKRNISRDDVKQALTSGEIIEDYPDDYPYPSYLIYSKVSNNPIHVVCGIDNDELWLITAYYPDLCEWYDDYRTRKEPAQ